VEKYNAIYYQVNTLNIKGMILRLQVFQPKCYTHCPSISYMLHAPLHMCIHFSLSLTYVKDSWKLCLHEPGFDQSSPQPVAPHPPSPLSSIPMSVEKGLISQQGQSAPENSTHSPEMAQTCMLQKDFITKFYCWNLFYIFIYFLFYLFILTLLYSKLWYCSPVQDYQWFGVTC